MAKGHKKAPCLTATLWRGAGSAGGKSRARCSRDFAETVGLAAGAAEPWAVGRAVVVLVVQRHGEIYGLQRLVN